MPRISNPHKVRPALVTAADKTALNAALLSIADNGEPSFDDIRAALSPAVRDKFTDGFLHQCAIDTGTTVLLP